MLRVPETAHLGNVVAQLRVALTQFSVVVDEFGSDAGILTLEDIVEELTRDFDTLAGWLLLRLRRVASPGDIVRADGLVATVLSVDGARIERIGLSAEERAEPAAR